MVSPASLPVMSERRTAWLGAILVGLGPICLPLFAPALPDLTAHFTTDQATGKAALTVYLAGFLSMQLVCGPLSDRMGRRPVAIGFALIFIAASLATLFAPDIRVFLLARLVQGIGAAGGVAVGRAIVLDQFPAARAVPIMTLISLILAVAPALAPVIGGAAASLGGWRATLETMLVLGLVQLAVIRLFLIETRPPETAPLRLRHVGANYLTMLREPRFLWATLGSAGATMAFQTQAVVLPFLLVERLKLSAFGFGLVMLGVSASYVLGNLMTRHIQRHHPPDRPIAVGVALFAVAMLLWIMLQMLVGLTLWTVVLPVALSGVAGAMMFPGLISFALMPFRQTPGAAAAMNMFGQLSLALLAALLVSAVDDARLGLTLSFGMASGLTLMAWLVWRRLPDRMG